MKSALVIFSVLAVFAIYASAEDVCYQPLEICVTMDESGSISGGEFNTMKTFAGNVASKFNLGTGTDDSRYSITGFNSSPRDVLNLNAGTSQAAVSGALSGFSKRGGGTNIVAGINQCAGQFSSYARGGVTRVLMVITDGYSSGDHGAAAAATGATVRIAVGVGSGVNNGVLSAIAGAGGLVINVANAAGLDAKIQEITEIACPCPEGFLREDGECVPQCDDGLYHEGYGYYTDVPTFVFDNRPEAHQSDYQLATGENDFLKMYYDENGKTYLARACNEKKESTYYAIDGDAATSDCVQEYFYGTGGDYGRLMGRQSRNGACNGWGLEDKLDGAYVRMVHRCQLNNVNEVNDVIHRDVCVIFKMKK